MATQKTMTKAELIDTVKANRPEGLLGDPWAGHGRRRRRVRVGTHNGPFHADDVMAVATLRLLGLRVEVTRSRDPKVHEDMDVLVDVGGGYEPESLRFDHHQRAGAGAREDGVPYASFGLVWREFGSLLIEEEGWGHVAQAAAQRVDESFVRLIDAADCGVGLAEGEFLSVSRAISGVNPPWHWEPHPSSFDALFGRAVEAGEVLLKGAIHQAIGAELAVKAVSEAYEARLDEGRIMRLTPFAPWQEVLLRDLEDDEVLFVVFQAPTGNWRVQCVPPVLGSFDKRLPLPEEWAGLRGEDLAELTGVEDAVFCHPGRFIAGAQTEGGVLALARLAINN